MHEAECPSPRQLTLEALRRDEKLAALLSNQRMRKIDRDVQLERGSWHRFVDGITIAYSNRRAQLQILHVPRLLRDPSCSQRVDKRLGAAIHNGWLGSTQLDHHVI